MNANEPIQSQALTRERASSGTCCWSVVCQTATKKPMRHPGDGLSGRDRDHRRPQREQRRAGDGEEERRRAGEHRPRGPEAKGE